ncbi:MAG TPA: SPOR domain-containing protein [Planctomycetota bacterium]|nr:SPOR domain-containing protein [Planctomycetota bacterium]
MVVRTFVAASRTLSSTVTALLIATAVLAALPGCDKEEDRIEIQAAYFGDSSRPSEITMAYSSLQNGQPGQAYAAAQGYIDAHPGSPYLPEAYYISGEALAAQGQYDDGKERLEVAIDKTNDRNLKALAMLGRADCNMGLEKYHLASRQYHWIELKYKDVKPLHQDELMFKLGLAAKKSGNGDWADYWFNQVNELYHTGPYAERARQENSHFTPPPDSREKPLVYFLEADAFSSPEKAEAGAANLRAKGYKDVEVVPSTRNSFKVYEIHIGKFTNKADAGRAQVDAKLAGLSTTLRPGTVEPLP